MKEVTLRDLLEAGCHFGHQTTRWNPKMKPFIYTARDGIHIFDLVKTKEGLEAAFVFAKTSASEGRRIIYIGTKRQAQNIIKESAILAGMPYMTERWVGGLLTNWEHVKRRLEHLRDLKAGVAENRFKALTKKERLLIDREIIKLMKSFGGIEDLMELPAAVFVADAKKDLSAIREANIRGIKVIAICDSNSSPDFVDFVIPANDDAEKSVKLIVDAISEAVIEGASAKASAPEGSEKKDVSVDVGAQRDAPVKAQKATKKAKKVEKK